MLFYHSNKMFQNVQFRQKYQIILSLTFNPCCTSPLLFLILVSNQHSLVGKRPQLMKDKEQKEMQMSFKFFQVEPQNCWPLLLESNNWFVIVVIGGIRTL